jgi:tetratricopeptide (TPR) repeat protein
MRSNAVELLRLTIELGDPREEAMARNDLACSLLFAGDLDTAAAEIERAVALCHDLGAAGHFPLAYLYSTRAELRIASGDPDGAIADCDAGLALASAAEDPEPYLTAMTTHIKIEALIASGDVDIAVATAGAELERLGDDVPHARSLILGTIATALRASGRLDEAFAALEARTELDRVTFEQLTARRLDLQRAALEAQAARHEAQMLTAKNTQLEELVSELRRAQAEEAA